jgi:predicted GNAT family acetyltransferase
VANVLISKWTEPQKQEVLTRVKEFLTDIENNQVLKDLWKSKPTDALLLSLYCITREQNLVTSNYEILPGHRLASNYKNFLAYLRDYNYISALRLKIIIAIANADKQPAANRSGILTPNLSYIKQATAEEILARIKQAFNYRYKNTSYLIKLVQAGDQTALAVLHARGKVDRINGIMSRLAYELSSTNNQTKRDSIIRKARDDINAVKLPSEQQNKQHDVGEVNVSCTQKEQRPLNTLTALHELNLAYLEWLRGKHKEAYIYYSEFLKLYEEPRNNSFWHMMSREWLFARRQQSKFTAEDELKPGQVCEPYLSVTPYAKLTLLGSFLLLLIGILGICSLFIASHALTAGLLGIIGLQLITTPSASLATAAVLALLGCFFIGIELRSPQFIQRECINPLSAWLTHVHQYGWKDYFLELASRKPSSINQTKEPVKPNSSLAANPVSPPTPPVAVASVTTTPTRTATTTANPNTHSPAPQRQPSITPGSVITRKSTASINSTSTEGTSPVIEPRIQPSPETPGSIISGESTTSTNSTSTEETNPVIEPRIQPSPETGIGIIPPAAPASPSLRELAASVREGKTTSSPQKPFRRLKYLDEAINNAVQRSPGATPPNTPSTSRLSPTANISSSIV